jgi:hypothetical protein
VAGAEVPQAAQPVSAGRCKQLAVPAAAQQGSLRYGSRRNKVPCGMQVHGTQMPAAQLLRTAAASVITRDSVMLEARSHLEDICHITCRRDWQAGPAPADV